MHCNRCNVEGKIYSQINASGSRVIVERCPRCGRNPNAKQAFLPLKDYDWDSLPLFADYSKDAQPCGYHGCTNPGSEYHHYAPRHLFEDADNWPGGPLCREHHKIWHETTQTGSYITQRQAA